MSLGDLGRPSGIPIYGYSPLLNGEHKTIQQIAYNYAELVAPPDPYESNEDYAARWNDVFNAKMRDMGWEYTGDHCMCADPDFRHEPACGWTRIDTEVAL